MSDDFTHSYRDLDPDIKQLMEADNGGLNLTLRRTQNGCMDI